MTNDRDKRLAADYHEMSAIQNRPYISWTAIKGEPPYAEEYLSSLKESGAEILLDHRSDPDNRFAYYALFEKEGKTYAAIFDAEEKVIHSLYYYNKNTVKDKNFIIS